MLVPNSEYGAVLAVAAKIAKPRLPMLLDALDSPLPSVC
jgi:hypothetical protein